VDVTPAIVLTGVGKRYDIVSCFAALTTVVAVDPNPLAPAQYAAQVRACPPRIEDPGYVPFLAELCERHGVGAVLPLTDLDIEALALARESGSPPTRLPALVPSSAVARATYDKYEAHLLLERLGLPSPPTVLPPPTAVPPPTSLNSPTVSPSSSTARPGADLDSLRYPVMVKPRRGSGARSIHLAHSPEQARFFVDYVDEPTMIQRAMGGPELSIDCLGDLDGRCLNAIPRTMLESRGGESIKGRVVDDPELVALGQRVMEALAVRGPATIQVFRDPELGVRITDVNTRFGGAFPAPMLAALPGRSYPELIVRMARGERIEPHVGEYRRDVTFTRYYWQLELDERMRPTGRDIVPGGPLRSS
jgi:carbamoyl-phosphate synthase large subunit